MCMSHTHRWMWRKAKRTLDRCACVSWCIQLNDNIFMQSAQQQQINSFFQIFLFFLLLSFCLSLSLSLLRLIKSKHTFYDIYEFNNPCSSRSNIYRKSVLKLIHIRNKWTNTLTQTHCQSCADLKMCTLHIIRLSYAHQLIQHKWYQMQRLRFENEKKGK